jgi:hypothetical protein
MNKNFIYIKDNFLSKKECNNFIKLFNKQLTKENINKGNYSFKDLFYKDFVHNEKFMNIFQNKFYSEIEEYKKLYPEIDMTASFWGVDSLRFKKFNIGESFSSYHSEHSMSSLNRVLNVQIYLSKHNCGTEFYRTKEVILSEIGRLAIFPAYFTHTHKGQVCPDKKERFIITGYVSFIKPGNFENVL